MFSFQTFTSLVHWWQNKMERSWLLAVGFWLLAVGCWLLAVGCWLLAGASSEFDLKGLKVWNF
jgi:hypothetical protein